MFIYLNDYIFICNGDVYFRLFSKVAVIITDMKGINAKWE